MIVTTAKQRVVIFALLALLMAATRYHHFGSLLHLPDASLAIFFLAGFYLPGVLALPVLLLEAGLIDWLAIILGAVSGWCVTPAYGFLIPAYTCLWYGGRWYAARHRPAWSTLLPLLGALSGATSLAFLVSNAGFWLFSGYFPSMPWAEYVAGVARYYPPYVAHVFLYAAIAALVHGAVALQTVVSAHDGAGRS